MLAAYLQHHPRPGRPEDREVLGGQLKALVSRALGGDKLSKQTLEIFIGAFRLRDDHAESLRRQWAGQEPASVIVGRLPPPDEVPTYRLKEYDVLMLHEHHWLGANGLPARHRTQINIRSRIDGLSVYQYRFDTHLSRVKTPRRGGMEIGPVYHVGGGIFAVDFTLDRPLRTGEKDYLEFWTILQYNEPPPREMRRGTHERINDFYMRVEFDATKPPSEVMWAEWAHYQGDDNRIIDREAHTVDRRLFVHRHLEEVERAVVGFTWEWKDASDQPV